MRAKPSICLLLETSKRLRHCVASHRRILPVLTCCLPFAHSGLSRFAYNGRYAKRLVVRCVPPPPIRSVGLWRSKPGWDGRMHREKQHKRRPLIVARCSSLQHCPCRWRFARRRCRPAPPSRWARFVGRRTALAPFDSQAVFPAHPRQAQHTDRQKGRQTGCSSPIKREQTSALPDKPNAAAPNPNTSVTWSDCVPESIVSSPSSGWH